jgi:hypothetical protein
MTITLKQTLPGAASFARPVFRLEMLSPTHNPVAAYPDAVVKGNLARGRRGQLMVVDRVDIFGHAYASALSNIVCLRGTNGADTAGDELYFTVTSVLNETVNTNWVIEKFGYVAQPSFSQPSAIAGQSNIQESTNFLGYFVATTGGQGEDTLEMMLPGLRYLERDSCFRQGIVPGAWGSRSLYLGAVAISENFVNSREVVAAPGVGKHSIIRTLILDAGGGPNHYRFGFGYSTNGLITATGVPTTTNIPHSGTTLVVNEHVGKLVYIVSGNRRGEVRQITANAANSVTVGTAFTLAPAAADTFHIIDPLMEYYSSLLVNGFALHIHETDLNIPVPENKAIHWYCEGTSSGSAAAPSTDFDAQAGCIIGVETADVATHNFVSLAGVAQ